MSHPSRREFLQTTGAAVAVAAFAGSTRAAENECPWKKAFMLGGVTSGPILPHFERLKEAGFAGVELISPNALDRAEVLKARDQTGIKIHGVSGAKHWQFTLSASRSQATRNRRGRSATRSPTSRRMAARPC